METSCNKFIENLLKTSDFLQATQRQTIAAWAPDSPPVTILFAAIGKELACRFDAMENERKKTIFNFIEDGMNSDDNFLRTAVATGIIEGIVSKSSKDEGLWLRIESELGPISKRHARSWRNTGLQN